jgi:RNA exonuclease NGL2
MPPTAEEIAQLRLARRLKKLELEALGAAAADFIQRPMLAVSPDGLRLKLKIMTYNMLAQALIRRKLFPTSGAALKWGPRSQALLAEMHYYRPHVMCLQELDYIQYNLFWKAQFGAMGYDSKFHRLGIKNHGVAIVYDRSVFVCTHLLHVSFDKVDTGAVAPSCITNNVALLASLEFKPRAAASTTKRGIIVGTTHLFWHPFGTYERTRQTYIILQKLKEFQQLLQSINEGSDWVSFLAGDFNSQPFDTPYLSLTSKPVKYEGRGVTVLGCSMSYEYSEARKTVTLAETPEDAEAVAAADPAAQPKDPVPDTFVLSDEQRNTVHAMEELHNAIDRRAISLYSVGYRHVHPENAGLDNDRHEPFFSNWAHAWRGLLDYIFVVTPWDQQYDCTKVDSVADVAANQGVRLLKLLRLPHPDEMGPEPSGQPRTGQYPSDHLCLMAEVEL